MRKILVALMCIGILVSWQICQSDLANAEGENNKCSPAGLWLSKSTDSDIEEVIATITPLDSTGKRFTGVAESILYFDPLFNGTYFPEDTKASQVYGYVERTSPGIYEASWYAYGVSKLAGGPVWKLVGRGIMEMVDCDHISEANVYHLYIPITVDDETVWYWVGDCNATTALTERITLAPACGEVPPLPDFQKE